MKWIEIFCAGGVFFLYSFFYTWCFYCFVLFLCVCVRLFVCVCLCVFVNVLFFDADSRGSMPL
jgi:hypothetical protein